MAKKNNVGPVNPEAMQNSKPYIEFEFKGKDYEFKGRLYKGYQKVFGKVTSTPLSIQIDDLLSISGCALKQTENNVWVSFPEYQNKNSEYVSYVYVDKDQVEFDNLAEYLAKQL